MSYDPNMPHNPGPQPSYNPHGQFPHSSPGWSGHQTPTPHQSPPPSAVSAPSSYDSNGTKPDALDITEKKAKYIGGGVGLLIAVLLLVVGGLLIAGAEFIFNRETGAYGISLLLLPIFSVLALIGGLLLLSTVSIIGPGHTRVVQFFGRYIGTVRKTGSVMTVTFALKRNVSIKVQNFETNELKVNDADGNPINIAAIIVWQVSDTARAIFAVENYREFISVQAEAALRHVASSYPYDNAAPGAPTLRDSTDAISHELAMQVADRVSIAGLKIIETRISSLAYAPEIAQAMLQRQQASAVISAREKIVEGAVGMVEDAVAKLDANGTVQMTDEQKRSSPRTCWLFSAQTIRRPQLSARTHNRYPAASDVPEGIIPTINP